MQEHELPLEGLEVRTEKNQGERRERRHTGEAISTGSSLLRQVISMSDKGHTDKRTVDEGQLPDQIQKQPCIGQENKSIHGYQGSDGQRSSCLRSP